MPPLHPPSLASAPCSGWSSAAWHLDLYPNLLTPRSAWWAPTEPLGEHPLLNTFMCSFWWMLSHFRGLGEPGQPERGKQSRFCHDLEGFLGEKVSHLLLFVASPKIGPSGRVPHARCLCGSRPSWVPAKPEMQITTVPNNALFDAASSIHFN